MYSGLVVPAPHQGWWLSLTLCLPETTFSPTPESQLFAIKDAVAHGLVHAVSRVVGRPVWLRLKKMAVSLPLPLSLFGFATSGGAPHRQGSDTADGINPKWAVMTQLAESAFG
jgi:hypothetical protein